MVKAERKPLEEIKEAVKGYARVLNVGCGGCVSVCLVGGQKEVNRLNAQLNLLFETERLHTRVEGFTVERQCNEQFLVDLDERVKRYDCLMSMACGAGVQLMAERYPAIPVFPAVNTVAIGIDREVGIYEERCRACGECVLGYTGGICPITRCAKSLFNGPCGGTNITACEVSKDIPCAWLDIYNRLAAQNRLDDIKKIKVPMEWQNTTRRMIVQEPYEKRYIEQVKKK
ncbi:MAG: methylenetetrahydrofolate reductase C-terminal domain-containing protein [Desulfobacterales bacterium]